MKLRKKRRNLFLTGIKYSISTIVLIIFINFNSNAQSGQGCLISDIIFGTRIYVTNTGSSTFWLGIPLFQDSYSTVCANGATNQIKRLGAGGTSDCAFGNAFVYQTGKIYNYTTVTCPLDDYTPSLFIPIALIGILRITNGKEKFANSL